MRVLMVGCNPDVMQAVDRRGLGAEIHVLEEPDLWRKLHLEHRCRATKSFGCYIPATYQQSDDYIRVLDNLPTVDCVLPGREYGVEPAARLAASLGLLGAGEAAAAAMTDKLRLREVTTGAGMRSPTYAEVRGPSAVAAFLRREGSCVLKPANRHANLGVVIVTDIGQVEEAWAMATAADEGPHLARAATRWRYMVERRLVGREYSTESLVLHGRIAFTNVTLKRVSPGQYPLVLGHDVPGVQPEESERFAAAVRQLVEATEFGTGVVHAEWIDDAEGLTLVEAAGRLPAGRICELIDLAYDFSLEGALLAVLSGRAAEIPATARQAAAIGFLTVSQEGRVAAIEGVDEVRSQPGVVSVRTLVEPGDEVRIAHSSWDRVGFLSAVASTRELARARVEELRGQVRIRVAP